MSTQDFVIKDGILCRYTGTDKNIVIPDDVVIMGKPVDYERYASPPYRINYDEFPFSGEKSSLEIESLYIGKNVTYIYEGCLVACGKIKHIEVDPENLFFYVKDNCLIDSISKTLVRGNENSIIPDDGSVLCIGPNAFKNCIGLEEIDIPGTVREIKRGAFAYCDNLARVGLNEGLNGIGRAAFSDCGKLDNIVVPESTTMIAEYAFADCSRLSQIKLPEGLRSISEGLFQNCLSLTEISIPNSVSCIGDGAFFKCTGLEKADMPDNMREINRFAFCECNHLKSVVIPEGVYSIDYYSFLNCSSLEKVSLPSTLNTIEYSAFEDCESLTNVMLPAGIRLVGENAFQNCRSLERINIPTTLEKIEEEAFSGCVNLSELSIEEGLKVLKISSAFWGCEKLRMVEFPDSLEDVCLSSFNDTLLLDSIKSSETDVIFGRVFMWHKDPGIPHDCVVPEGIKGIAWDAFEDRGQLEHLYLPESVVFIPPGEFCADDEGRFTICAPGGSCAEEYAKMNDIPFIDTAK